MSDKRDSLYNEMSDLEDEHISKRDKAPPDWAMDKHEDLKSELESYDDDEYVIKKNKEKARNRAMSLGTYKRPKKKNKEYQREEY